MSIPRPWWEGLEPAPYLIRGEGVNCYKITNFYVQYMEIYG